ncbi:MAG: glutamine--tRNA ligase/YqeY domain fusion protein [Phycisphaeraceae bacterium]|nr:glutamine--tRNA ligase/YqeY domain fusion protein [Phycisphaeraceae bacterium]
MSEPASKPPTTNFLHDIIDADNASGRWGSWPGTASPRVHTRFPPEPNGYLHIGHSKSICLNYGLAVKYGGKFNLRFDDTNPSKEDREYIDSIIRDVRWLGAEFEHGPHAGGLFFSSDYFDRMYAFAEELIQKGHAYVCELSADEVSKRRGTPSTPATSPFRDRPRAESLRLFRQMRAGKHPNGAMTLRARIDLASPNFNLRDPVMYRIVHEPHPHVGAAWCIYPMYDWAHGLEDSIEGITHSICTLEFEIHRPLYDWFINAINEDRGPGSPWGPRIHHSQQIEFAKLRPTYTILSKRNLLKMVEQGVVSGWDDPRMPTLSGMRRRGYTPEAIRAFCEDVGVTRFESSIDVGRLENALRDHLNRTAPRTMAVLRPLRVVIDNWPAGSVDMLDFTVNPEDPAAGTTKVPFTGELFIEQEDFAENPPPGFFRLAPGAEVRLRWAYFITCTRVDKNPDGSIKAVHCTYDPATRGGDCPPGPDGKPARKVKGTLHWISARPDHAAEAEVRLYERLFTAEEPGARTGNYLDDLNPNSVQTLRARIDPRIASAAKAGDKFQFERLGYFCVDTDSAPGRPIFNRAVTLKDSRDDKPKATVRTYTFAEAAHELKVKQDRLVALLPAAGLAAAAQRAPGHLTLDEVRSLKDWVKKNPPARG